MSEPYRVKIFNQRIEHAECYAGCEDPECPYMHQPSIFEDIFVDVVFPTYAMAHRFIDDQDLHVDDVVEVYPTS